jgi:mannonate dehydratase
MPKPLIPVEPGLKIALQISPEPSEDELLFAKQMGLQHMVMWTDSSKSSAEYYAARKQFFESAGLKVYGFGNGSVHNVEEITLNLPGRDAKIDEYLRHIRDLGKAGIPYTTYAHMANGIWSTTRETTRGGAPARAFDAARVAEEGFAMNGKKRYQGDLTHGRTYTEDEIWENYTYFIKKVVPVAEEAGVRIGIHPDDPPGITLAGIPRPIFSSFEGYKRALEIADSPNIGMCLCAGCWLEGGEAMGRDVNETIRYFGGLKKLFKVHFRNVHQAMPYFVETFIDDGYMNMYEVLKAMREVEFDGVFIADHIPLMAGDPRVGTAYTIGYMKALLERVNAEAL